MNERGSVHGRYRRLRPLGTGGSARVWLVEDALHPGSRMALKEALSRDGAPRDLRPEFVLQRRLRHPGIVELFDFVEGDDATPCAYTMEFVDGTSLREAGVADDGASFVTLAAEALSTLAFLHERGVLHRDVNPANLAVRRTPRLDTRIALFDLGLAELRDAESARRGPVGVLPFVAPEIFDGAPFDRAADLYALGAVLWDAAYGQPPYVVGDGDAGSAVERIRGGRREPPSRTPPFDAAVGEWLEGLLSPDPARRPGDALEALAGLAEASGSTLASGRRSLRWARLASDPPPIREEALATLVGLLERSARPRVFWLRGEDGSGKSRLLASLKTEAIAAGWTVAEAAAAWDPEWPAGDADARAERLRWRSARGPCLCMLDDAETVDARVLRTLERIVREGGDAPVRVVAAVDPSSVASPRLRRMLDGVGSVPPLEGRVLPPLDADEIRRLVERCTGSEESSSARVEWLGRVADGSPARAARLLVDQAWQTGEADAPDEEELRRDADRSVERLDAEAREWLTAAAALGPSADDRRIARLLDRPPERAFAAAETVRTRGLADRHAGRWSIASGVRRALDARVRGDRDLCTRAAGLLEAERDDPDAAWRAARLAGWLGDDRRAIASADRAAAAAEASGDPEHAARCLAFALGRAGRDRTLRHGLRVRQAEALGAAGRFVAAARAWSAAASLADDDDTERDLRLEQARALVYAGRLTHAERIARRVGKRTDGASAVAGRALVVRGMALGRSGREVDAVPLLEDAVARLRRAEDTLGLARALQVLAACRSRLRDERAEADFEASIETFESLARHEDVLKNRLGLAVLHQRNGDLERAAEILDDVRRRAEARHSGDLVETAISKSSSIALACGRIDRAIALAEQSLAHARHLGDATRVLLAVGRLAEALLASGMPARAAKRLRAALADPEARVEPDARDFARLLLAQALSESPAADVVEARDVLRRARDGFDARRRRVPFLVALAVELELEVRRGTRAGHDRALAAWDAAVAGSPTGVETDLLARVDIAEARYRLDRGDAAAARERARAAVARLRGEAPGARLVEAFAIAAEAEAAAGDAEAAERLRNEGREGLDIVAKKIEDDACRKSFVRRSSFEELVRPVETGADARRLQALYNMIRALNSETDPVSLLDTVLEMAVRGVNAERGFVLLREPDGEFRIHASQQVERETLEDARQLSRELVDRAGLGESVLALDTGDDREISELRSVSLYGIRSLMCVPLRSRGTLIGTVYLDRRRGEALFDSADVRFIEAFADHAALALENAKERAALREENRRLRAIAGRTAGPDEIVGESAPMQRVYELIDRAADSELPVLVHGESGTGKELVARALHARSRRERSVFLSENCAAIPDTLLESELFGHVRGAFTGAERDRAGLFEQADGGTLFLDEVGDMSPAMQARLLRVLQEGEVRRVGADRPVAVDVRLIAATHRDLATEVERGRFREDLFYRLQVLQIALPPLRERGDDVDRLIDHLLARIARERGTAPAVPDEMTRRLLATHPWPGNVRQLENTLQRLTLVAGPGPLRLEHLRADPTFRSLVDDAAGAASPAAAADGGDGAGGFSLARGERVELQRALAAARGNRTEAARLLGVSRATVYRKIKQFGIS